MPSSPTLFTLGIAIKKYRRRKSWSQANLADHCELSRSFLSEVEQGKKNISIETLSKIAGALDASPAELLTHAPLESEPTRISKRVVKFLKLGGTWDMTVSPHGLHSMGGLDDQTLQQLEQTYPDERELLEALSKRVFAQQPIGVLHGRLRWAKSLHKLVRGLYTPLFSTDSSHYRPSLIATLLAAVLFKLKEPPHVPILVGLGTDTTDLFLPLLDAFLFDSNAQPVISTGANRSHREKNSDAPQHFNDLGYAAHLPLLPGAYYVFQGYLYRGGDLVKVDPHQQPRPLDGMTTFFAPHHTQLKLDTETTAFMQTIPHSYPGTTLTAWSATALYTAFSQIYTLNIGHLNPVELDCATITNPKWKVLIIESHALGNANNRIKEAVRTAVQNGTIVINVSRCLVPETNQRYQANLAAIPGVVNGGKISATLAKGLALRALLEKRNAAQTQDLFTKYSQQIFE